ncbi:WD40-repeat-containing domain protein [Boletus reticuloceps]|uniref:WD40-repeat-containing domain protein n=1 Tax=Boletus reticuloceps TaxID=495285 RepID=A0A8I2YM48_9AGAM|nr:WD40-repeat-containing domain protein [Boletus reticuloceps]
MQNPEPRCIDIRVHGDPITSLVFCVDGKHIVGGCMDGSIRRWRVSDWGETEPAMKSDGMVVKSVVASSDGRWIAGGGVDRGVMVWSATSYEKVGGPFERCETGVTALDISPDSSHIAAGLEDGSVVVWRLESRERIAGPLRHDESLVSSVKFSPTGDGLASACSGRGSDPIRIWDSRTGELLACLSTDTKPTYSLDWTLDGRRLFAGGPRGSIRCFDIASRTVLSAFGDQYCDSVTSLCISNNDRFLVAGSESGCSLSLWDVNTFEPILPTLSLQSEVSAMAVSPDDQHLAVGTIDKKITIWSLSDLVPMTYFFHRLSPFPASNSEPFAYISNAVHGQWRHGNLEEAEEILSNEITQLDCPEFVTYSRANRALVRARLRKWDKALEDVRMLLRWPKVAHTPPIAHVADAFVLFGEGNHQEATQAIDSALCLCNDNTKPFVKLIKLIILFEVGHHDEVEVFCYKTEPSDCTPDVASLRSVVKAQLLVLLAEHSMMEQDCSEAIKHLEKAQSLRPFIRVPELRTISLIFGWNFDGLNYVIQQQKCAALFASGRTRDAIDALVEMQKDLKGEAAKRKEVHEWLDGLKKQCLEASESLAEEAMRNGNYDDAIAWYSAALDLDPASPEQILMKRSDAYAAKDSWENALRDANEVFRRNVLFPQAYECRALRKLERYDEFVKTLNELPDSRKYTLLHLRDVPAKCPCRATLSVYTRKGGHCQNSRGDP